MADLILGESMTSVDDQGNTWFDAVVKLRLNKDEYVELINNSKSSMVEGLELKYKKVK
jgi:hypothetical protein